MAHLQHVTTIFGLDDFPIYAWASCAPVVHTLAIVNRFVKGGNSIFPTPINDAVSKYIGRGYLGFTRTLGFVTYVGHFERQALLVSPGWE